jgi:hypothetical protein
MYKKSLRNFTNVLTDRTPPDDLMSERVGFKDLLIEQIQYVMSLIHVSWVPCHPGMAHAQVVDAGDGLQLWRKAVN